MRAGRVLSRNSPSTPSAMNRSCQRQTQVLATPVSRMIAAVPMPAAVRRIIRLRQTCFCGLFRSNAIASSRARSDNFKSMLMPVRIQQTRITASPKESTTGPFCQILSTRTCSLVSRFATSAFRRAIERRPLIHSLPWTGEWLLTGKRPHQKHVAPALSHPMGSSRARNLMFQMLPQPSSSSPSSSTLRDRPFQSD